VPSHRCNRSRPAAAKPAEARFPATRPADLPGALERTAEHPGRVGSRAALCAEQREAFGEQFRNGPGKQDGIVGAGEQMQVVERQAAPGCAQNSQQAARSYGLSSAPSQCQGVQDLGASGELSSSMARKGIAASRSARAMAASDFFGAGKDGDAVL